MSSSIIKDHIKQKQTIGYKKTFTTYSWKRITNHQYIKKLQIDTKSHWKDGNKNSKGNG